MRDSDLIIRWRTFEDPALALGLYELGNTHTHTCMYITYRRICQKKYFLKHKHRGAAVRVKKNTGVGFS